MVSAAHLKPLLAKVRALKTNDTSGSGYGRTFTRSSAKYIREQGDQELELKLRPEQPAQVWISHEPDNPDISSMRTFLWDDKGNSGIQKSVETTITY